MQDLFEIVEEYYCEICDNDVAFDISEGVLHAGIEIFECDSCREDHYNEMKKIHGPY